MSVGIPRFSLLATSQPPAAELWARLPTYLSERAKVEEETRWLTGLFSEALKLPALATISHPVDCPLCATKNALTPDRVERIRKHVEETSAFNKAHEAAKAALSQLSASITSLASAYQAALPAYLKSSGKERRKTGFTVSRIRALLGDEAAEPIKQWLSSARSLARASAAIRRAAKKTEEIVKAQTDNLAAGLDEYKLKQAFSVLSGTHDALVTAATAYAGPADAIVGALNRVIDAQSNTAGWQDFVDVARSPAELRSALIERLARASVFKELETALKEIDRAKERVLDDKFEDYSVHVQNWWERLRPDEPTFFSAVQPRKGAKRTIDFKAGLSPNADRSAPKLRDVIAVFSLFPRIMILREDDHLHRQFQKFGYDC